MLRTTNVWNSSNGGDLYANLSFWFSEYRLSICVCRFESRNADFPEGSAFIYISNAVSKIYNDAGI